MPPAVAAAAVTAGGAIIGSKMQSGAISKGAQLQTQASNYAAQQQAEASRRAEEFQRQQAQVKWIADETDRRANYDQWASREKRLGSVGEILGWGQRDIPAYVPSPDPRLGPAQTAAPQPPETAGGYLGGRVMKPTPRTAGAYLGQRTR